MLSIFILLFFLVLYFVGYLEKLRDVGMKMRDTAAKLRDMQS